MRVVLAANGLHGAFGVESAQNFDGQLGAYAVDGDQALEKTFLFALEKAEEGDLIFADLGVDVERSLRPHARQRRKRRHGDGDVVSDAGGFDDGLAGFFVDELAAEVSDHCGYCTAINPVCITTKSNRRSFDSLRALRMTNLKRGSLRMAGKLLPSG